MARIGLLCAFKQELPSVIPVGDLRKIQIHTVGSFEVGVLVSGIGQSKATEATERLCTGFKPDALLVLGVCGAADRRAGVGTLLVADKVYYREARELVRGQEVDVVKQCLTEAAIPYIVGGIETFDHPVLSKERVSAHVLGVDMEAFAIVRRAKEHGVPPIVIKSVSDLLPERTPTLFPGPRLYWRVLRNFRTAKRGLNAVADSFLRPTPA